MKLISDSNLSPGTRIPKWRTWKSPQPPRRSGYCGGSRKLFHFHPSLRNQTQQRCWWHHLRWEKNKNIWNHSCELHWTARSHPQTSQDVWRRCAGGRIYDESPETVKNMQQLKTKIVHTLVLLICRLHVMTIYNQWNIYDKFEETTLKFIRNGQTVGLFRTWLLETTHNWHVNQMSNCHCGGKKMHQRHGRGGGVPLSDVLMCETFSVDFQR